MAVKWRDIFDLNIDDRGLKTSVEGFLDYFENAEFPYDRQDPNTGAITQSTISGQQVLEGIAVRLKLYEENGLAKAFSDPKMAERLGLSGEGPNGILPPGESVMHDGKFVIRSHDQEFKGDPKTGANTISMVLPGMSEPLVLGINLGKDYLRGAQYYGVDGNMHPVTVEGVLVNELAHMDQGASAEAASILLESIVTVSNGGVQREPGNSYIDFSSNSNGGFQTLRSYEDVIKPDAGVVLPEENPQPDLGQNKP